MPEQHFASLLSLILNLEVSEDERAEALESLWEQGRMSIRSFAAEGLLTDDEGLVVKLGAAEYQLTVVRSR